MSEYTPEQEAAIIAETAVLAGRILERGAAIAAHRNPREPEQGIRAALIYELAELRVRLRELEQTTTPGWQPLTIAKRVGPFVLVVEPADSSRLEVHSWEVFRLNANGVGREGLAEGTAPSREAAMQAAETYVAEQRQEVAT